MTRARRKRYAIHGRARSLARTERYHRQHTIGAVALDVQLICLSIEFGRYARTIRHALGYEIQTKVLERGRVVVLADQPVSTLLAVNVNAAKVAELLPPTQPGFGSRLLA